VDEVEATKKKVVEFLKTIKTAEDLKEHKDELIDLMEELIKSALTVLKKSLEAALSMDSDGKEKELEKFQDESWLFDETIGVEMNRIETLDGADELFETFTSEMEERIGPHMEAITQEMTKFMESLFGGMMEGMAEGMGEMMGGFGDDDEPPEVASEPYDNREDLSQYDQVYDYETFRHLKDNKDWIIEAMVETLDNDLENLKNVTEMEFPKEQILEDLDKAERHATVFIEEIGKQFMRIGTLPDAGEYAQAAVDELKSKTKPNVEKVMEYKKKYR
jgi:hypothetical protein